MAEPATIEEPKIEINSVPPEMIDYVWSSQREQLKKMHLHGQGDMLSLDEVLRKLKQGELQMWVINRGFDDILGFVVFKVMVSGWVTKIWVTLLVGKDFDLWTIQLRDLSREFMELIGADCVEASCRPGMAKHLKSIGWSQKAVIMELK